MLRDNASSHQRLGSYRSDVSSDFSDPKECSVQAVSVFLHSGTGQTPSWLNLQIWPSRDSTTLKFPMAPGQVTTTLVGVLASWGPACHPPHAGHPAAGVGRCGWSSMKVRESPALILLSAKKRPLALSRLQTCCNWLNINPSSAYFVVMLQKLEQPSVLITKKGWSRVGGWRL